MSKQSDLFDPHREINAPLTGPRKVGLPKRKPTPLRGHFFRLGTGPEGETCGTCDHYTRVYTGCRHFRKCGLNKANWTHGPGSDIRARDLACKFWVRPEKEPPPA